MEHNDIQKQAFIAAAKTLASAALKKSDKAVRAVGKKVGKGGKAMANKAKPGSVAGKMDMRTKKMQRIVGGSTLAGGGLAAGAMMGGDEEKKASRESAQLGALYGGGIGAAVGAEKGKKARTAGGAIAGGIAGTMGGGAAGAGLGALLHKRTGGMSTAAGGVLGAMAGNVAGSVVGAGKGHDSATKKLEEKKKKGHSKKAEAVFAKLSGYTAHGKAREEARALEFANVADAFEEADKASPGMSYLKGSHVQTPVLRMIARKQAYKADQKGLGNVKTHIPFVGMGPKGQEALDKVKKKSKKSKK